MNRSHDIEGEFYVLPFDQGGRNTPVYSGYRPQHKIHENYQTSGLHEYVNTDQVKPAETVSTRVWLLTPDVYPSSIWVGRQIQIFEGARKVGVLTVTRVLNVVLLGSSDTFNPVWVEPAGLNAQGTKTAD